MRKYKLWKFKGIKGDSQKLRNLWTRGILVQHLNLCQFIRKRINLRRATTVMSCFLSPPLLPAIPPVLTFHILNIAIIIDHWKSIQQSGEQWLALTLTLLLFSGMIWELAFGQFSYDLRERIGWDRYPLRSLTAIKFLSLLMPTF